MCSYAQPHSWQLCKTAAFWRSIQHDSKAVAVAPTQAWRWLPRAATYKEVEEKIQPENLQNGLLLPSHSILKHLSSRRPLRLPCCARGGREGQRLLQFVFPESLCACLQPPEVVSHISHSYRSQQGFSQCLQDSVKWVPSSWLVTVASVPCASCKP